MFFCRKPTVVPNGFKQIQIFYQPSFVRQDDDDDDDDEIVSSENKQFTPPTSRSNEKTPMSFRVFERRCYRTIKENLRDHRLTI